MYRLIRHRTTVHGPAGITRASGRIISLALAILFLSPFGIGCGRKTDPRPPELVAPMVVEGVNVTNAPDGIRIGWPRPTHYVDGSRMLDLGGFQIERSTEGSEFEVLSTLRVKDRDRFRQIGSFRYLDESVTEGRVYGYRIVSFTTDNYFSSPSEPVELVRELPEPGAD